MGEEMVEAERLFEKSGSGYPLAVRVGEAVQHEADHGQLDHGLGDLGQLLVLPGEAAPPAEPAERPLRHPAPGEEDEAGAAREPAHDDQGQPEQEAGQQGREPVVGAVGEHDLEPGVEPLQPPQQVDGAVRVLDVGGVDDDPEQQAAGVDRDVPLPALDLLGRVVAAGPPFSVAFTLWVSMMAAEGLGSRPSRSRSITTRWWRIVSHTPASAKARM